MKYVTLPESAGAARRPLPFYLAMEEYIARNFPAGRYFFMWRVDPTVIMGRCQNPYAEVDLEYCRREGIHVCRRKSGGGTVYADPDNIMMSYITPSERVMTTFASYCELIADALRSLDIEAESTGRNDVIVRGRKISGMAFYNLYNRAIVHSTMLFGCDPDRMARAISPSPAKLAAKGVRSVRSRVTTVGEYRPDLSIDQFIAHFRSRLCGDNTLVLTPQDVASIEQMAAPYFSPVWIFGRDARASQPVCNPHRKQTPQPSRRLLRRKCRIEGVGEFSIALTLSHDPGPRIEDVEMQGDFFLLSDLDATLLTRLRGIRLQYDAIVEALSPIRLEDVIAGLKVPAFARMLTADY